MKLGITHLAASPYDGAGIAMCRQRDALSAAGYPSRLLCSGLDPRSAPQGSALCPKDRRTILQRARRRIWGRGDCQEEAERQVASALGSATEPNVFELFSTPYSRFSPQSHPWIKEADVVNFHWVASFVDYARFFASFHKPSVWTLHDQGPYLGGFHYESDRDTAPGLRALDDHFRRIKKEAVERSAAKWIVVGNSYWNTDRALSSGFFPSGTRFETIYYPLDTSIYSPVEKASAKQALGIPAGEFTVGFACTSLDNPRKGFGDLVNALKLLSPAAGSRAIGLLSFGRLPDAVSRASIQVPWHQFGFLESDAMKAKMYSAMDCFVIPSRAEAFGQTAIEAMACATPVIGTKVGGIVEALDGGKAGLLFDHRDPGEIALLVRHLLDYPSEARALADAGRDLVRKRHAPDRCAAAYNALYTELATPV